MTPTQKRALELAKAAPPLTQEQIQAAVVLLAKGRHE